MSKIIKIMLIVIISILTLAVVGGIASALVNNYARYNTLSAALSLPLAVLICYGAVKLSKQIWGTVAVLLLIITGCSYAKSNQQVVVSEDCGVTWKKVNIGDAVPRAGVNVCYMKVVIPNYPMQGESKFLTNLKDKVRAIAHIDYDYSITDPLLFIKQAKFLGNRNADADSDAALNGKTLEIAENMVIDKRIKEVAKGYFIDEDIVDMDQSDLEAKLLVQSNKVLEEFGVQLNFITLTFDLDEQTRQAIDVSTAMKIYESKGLQDVGKSVMIQRAGATKITVDNKTVNTGQEANNE